MVAVTVGIDVGQKVDPTAIAVGEWERDRYLVRFLERLPLGTPYPQVAERLKKVVDRVAWRLAPAISQRNLLPMPEAVLRARGHVWILVDATGVGQPVVDLLRDGVGAEHIHGVFFTHGDRHSWGRDGTVGKAYLVSRLQTLIQTKRIALPQTAEARTLADELLAYEIRVSEDANTKYGAFKVGTHDDLVTALGLAVLRDASAYVQRVATTFPR